MEKNLRRNINPIESDYRTLYDQVILNFVNEISGDDFENFGFEKVENIEELSKCLPREGRPDNNSLILRLQNNGSFGEDLSISIKTNSHGECKV